MSSSLSSHSSALAGRAVIAFLRIMHSYLYFKVSSTTTINDKLESLVASMKSLDLPTLETGMFRNVSLLLSLYYKLGRL
jgi:hypothetical protein